jgi:serine/threonine-protein kinase
LEPDDLHGRRDGFCLDVSEDAIAMTNTDLGACEVFISELRRSNLVERGQLDHLLEDFIQRNPRADAQALAEHLVQRGTLTAFQAERIITGKTQGLVLGAYVLTDGVGSGSMGSVYRAISKNDQKAYAVKVLPRRSMWNVRLARRQVRAFSQFQHPSVVPFVDVGTSGGLHYLVWNFVQGETLEAVVKRLGKLDAGSTAQIGVQIASGLAAAHGHGLFHGLLKPSNIMIGEGGRVRILDFGIGSLLAENEGESLVDTMSTSNTLTSGLDCASPESIMEPMNRTPAGDQYSLGCMLYFCLTGHYPFSDGSAVEKMMAHQFKQPAPVAELAPGTPPDLAGVIDRLMQKKPEDRYHGIDGAAEALVPIAPNGQPAAPQAMVQTPTAPQTRPGVGRPVPSAHATLPSSHAPLPQSHAPLPPSHAPHPSAHAARPSAHAPHPSSHAARKAPPPAPPPPPVADAPPLFNSSMMDPDLLPASRQPARRPSSFHGSAPMPAPVPLPASAPGVPTRKSLRGLPPLPPQGEYPPTGGQPESPVRASMFAGSNPLPPEEAPKPIMGPIGFLLLGATVAVAFYVLVTNLIQ